MSSSHQLFVERIPEAIAERRRFDAAALARIGVQQAADEALLLDALLEIRQHRLRADAGRQRQAAHAAERVGIELHLLGDDVVGLFDEPLHELRDARSSSSGRAAARSAAGRCPTSFSCCRCDAAEDRRVQRFLDVVVVGRLPPRPWAPRCARIWPCRHTDCRAP